MGSIIAPLEPRLVITSDLERFLVPATLVTQEMALHALVSGFCRRMGVNGSKIVFQIRYQRVYSEN